jgi:hypothetical protein
MRITCPPLSGCSSRPTNSPSDSIAERSSVNITRPDAFRHVCYQRKHFIPHLPSRFLSTCGKNFELLRGEPLCHFDLPVLRCRVPVFSRVRVRRVSPREDKRQCATPAHSSAPRRSSRRINRCVGASQLHCNARSLLPSFWGRLNRERLISEPVGFDQASN